MKDNPKVIPMWWSPEPPPPPLSNWADIKVGGYFRFHSSPPDLCKKLSDDEYECCDANGVYQGDRRAFMTWDGYFIPCEAPK